MASIKFYFDDRRAKPDKPVILKLAVAHKSKTSYVSLDIKLLPSQWDERGCKVKNHPDKVAYNAFISDERRKAEAALAELAKNGSLATMSIFELRDHIKETLHPTKTEEPDQEVPVSLFLPRFLTFIAPKKESTKEIYEHTLNRIKAHIGEEGLKNLKFEDITLDWLNEFNAFMAKTSPSPNARNVHFRNLRAVFNNAIENEVTTHYPFRKFKIKAVETAKRSLTVEELRRLFFFPCEEHQVKYLDMFKLMFYLMGVNMIDLAKLTEINNGRLDFNRSKTGHLYSMKVEPEAMALFEKHKGTDHLLFILDRWVNDEFFRRKMNKELQKIGPMHKKPGRGGKKLYEPMFPEITAYWARHSWATIASDIDIPDRIIAEALGHEYGNRITNIYINFNIKKVDAANRKVLDWVLYGKIDGEEVVRPGSPEFFGLDLGKTKELGLYIPSVKDSQKTEVKRACRRGKKPA